MVHMVRKVLAAAAVAALSVGAVACGEPPPPPPPPASTVDASYTESPVNNEVNIMTLDRFGQTARFAQSFTAGRSGTLDMVSAILGPPQCCGSLVPVTVSVQTLDGNGKPSGTVLGQGVWNGPALPDTNTFADIPLTDTAEVVAGQQYALVFENPAPTNMRLYLAAPDYPGGQSFEGFATGGASPGWSVNPYDEVPFKTWVR